MLIQGQYIYMNARWNALRVWAKILLHDIRFVSFFKLYVNAAGFVRLVYAEIVYRFALLVHFPWPRAYMWRAARLSSHLHQIISSDSYTKTRADVYYTKAKNDLIFLCTVPELCVEAASLLAINALLSGRTDEWISWVLREYDFQEQRAEVAGASSVGFRCLEPSFSILQTIGHTMHLDGLIKSGILGMRPPFRIVLLLQPWLKRFVVNPCMLDYWRAFIDVVDDPQELASLHPLAKPLAFNLHGATPCGSRLVPFSISTVVATQLQWEKEGRQPLFQLTSSHRQRGVNILDSWGVPRDGWFVTLHVRGGTKKGAELYRDSSLGHYFDAVQTITNAGGWVIRMGDPSMERMPKLENVVDYAHDPEKTDWLDVFLCAAARFMIGTSSGLTTVSYAFGVPIAMTNCLPTASLYLSKQDIFLPRLMRNLADGKMLCFSQIMGLPYSMGITDGMYKNILGVETIENSSEEISDLVGEMLDGLEGKARYSVEDERMQRIFSNITVDRETLVGSGGVRLPARIGRRFLSNHQSLLS